MTNAYATGIGPRAVAAYAGVAAAAADYLAALAGGDDAELARLTAPIWHAKRALASLDLLAVERADLAGYGGAGDYLSSVSLCGGDFAVARADRSDPMATTFLLLFKDRGAWRVAGEASTGVEFGERDARFTARTAEAEVLNVLETYYRAVTGGDPVSIRRIFAPCWHMKNHEDGALVVEGVDAFAARLAAPLPDYWSDRQIADVQIANNRIAYVRVDRPSTPSTTVFLFARGREDWTIIDKAWTDGREPPL